jgi:hypothetical protein
MLEFKGLIPLILFRGDALFAIVVNQRLLAPSDCPSARRSLVEFGRTKTRPIICVAGALANR